MSEQDFKPGIRFAITWLHSRANEMNDTKAKQILDSAAFALGVAKAKGGFVLNDDYEALRERLAEVERALVIANAQLADMEFLSIEGFISWKQDRIRALASETAGGSE